MKLCLFFVPNSPRNWIKCKSLVPFIKTLQVPHLLFSNSYNCIQTMYTAKNIHPSLAFRVEVCELICKDSDITSFFIAVAKDPYLYKTFPNPTKYVYILQICSVIRPVTIITIYTYGTIT